MDGRTDLNRFARSIDERMWAAVVQARQVNPNLGGLEQAIPRVSAMIRDVVDSELSVAEPRPQRRQAMVDQLSTAMEQGTLRTALQEARIRGQTVVTEASLQSAYRLQKDLLVYFWEENREAQAMRLDVGQASSRKPGSAREQKSRTSAVQNALLLEPGLTTGHLWLRIKASGQFEDEEDLRGYLANVRLKGRVIGRQEKWYWVS